MKDFIASKSAHKAIVTLSECTETYADLYLPFHSVNGIPVNHLPWSSRKQQKMINYYKAFFFIRKEEQTGERYKRNLLAIVFSVWFVNIGLGACTDQDKAVK